jgi:hypothetical protein
VTGAIRVEARSVQSISQCQMFIERLIGIRRTKEYDKSHREATESTHSIDEEKFGKIMYSRINPSTTLRHQHFPIIRSDSLSGGLFTERHLEIREVLHHDRSKISIFSKR